MNARREVYAARFSDDLMHAMRSTNDGVRRAPLCGKEVDFKDAGEDSDFFCEDCVPLMAVELGIDPDKLVEALKEEALKEK